MIRLVGLVNAKKRGPRGAAQKASKVLTFTSSKTIVIPSVGVGKGDWVRLTSKKVRLTSKCENEIRLADHPQNPQKVPCFHSYVSGVFISPFSFSQGNLELIREANCYMKSRTSCSVSMSDCFLVGMSSMTIEYVM